MNELQLLAQIKSYLLSVRAMRQGQKEYFATKQKNSLVASKCREKEIDTNFDVVMQAVNDLIFVANEVVKNNEEM